MTYKEKLEAEYPVMVCDAFEGGCMFCPCFYGYEAENGGLCAGRDAYDAELCRKCWGREAAE